MSDYIPTPKLPDFFAPKPTSGALTYTPTTEEVRDRYNTFDNPKTEAEFDRWLAKRDQKLMAQAWDRGYEAGLTDFASSMTTNPYRQGEKIILSNNDYDQLRKALDEE